MSLKSLSFPLLMLMACLAFGLHLKADLITPHFDFQTTSPYSDDGMHLEIAPITLRHLWAEWLPQNQPFFYRPTFTLYCALTNRLFGENATGHHAAGVVLHGFVVWLLALLTLRLTQSRWACGLVAGVFLLQNNYDEAVGWMSANSALLAAFFAIATFHFWMSWRQTSQRIYLFGAFASLFLSLCSKQDAVPLAPMLILFDVLVFRPQNFRKAAILYLTVGLIFAVYFALHRACEWRWSVGYPKWASVLNDVPLFVRLTIRLWNEVTLNAFRLSLVGMGEGFVSFVAAVALWRLGFKNREESKGLILGTLWVVLTCSFMVLAINHSASVSRFLYLPVVGGSSLVICLFVGLWRQHRFVSAAFGTIAALQLAPLTFNIDPLLLSLVALLPGLIALLLGKPKTQLRATGVVLLAAGLASQFPIYLGLDFLQSLFLAALLAFPFLEKHQRWPQLTAFYFLAQSAFCPAIASTIFLLSFSLSEKHRFSKLLPQRLREPLRDCPLL